MCGGGGRRMGIRRSDLGFGIKRMKNDALGIYGDWD